VDTDAIGRELVLERTRYARNESLEYFDQNFGPQIRLFSFMNAGDLDDD